MTFAVDTDVLRSTAEGLARRAEETATASDYVADHIQLPWMTAGLYLAAAHATTEIRESLQSALAAQRECLASSSTEMALTAYSYDHVDDDVARNLDLFLSAGSSATPLSVPWSRAVYIEPAAPTTALVVPDLAGGHDYLADAVGTDWFSLTAAVDQLITWTFGYDPLAEATRLLAGDWDRALTCSQGLSAAAEFERLTAGNIGTSASHCRDGWSGNAADAADRYLKGLSSQLQANGDAIDLAAPYFSDLHAGIVAASSILKGLFAEAIDMALAGTLSYAIAAATSETIVGGVVGYLAGSAAFARLAWLAKSIWDVIQSAIDTANWLVTAVSGVASFGSGPLTLPIPAGYHGGLGG